MTERIKGLVVTLDQDYREDDVESIVQAICMVKGVAHVALEVANLEDHFARMRVRRELANELGATFQRVLEVER